MVGINSPSYFSKLFLKQFGVSPKDFEKQSLGGKEKIDIDSYLKQFKMEKKYTITLRLSYDQFAWLGALCRRSKQTQSAVIRSLIENGTVRERITKEHIHIIRQLIGESTNLNQLAKQANTYGFFAVAKRCEEMAQRINQLIKQLKDDR